MCPFRESEYDAVVLVGIERLLVTAFTAHRDPAQPYVIQAHCRELEIDDAAGQKIVERGQHLRYLRCAHALCEHVARKAPNLLAGPGQLLRVLRVADAVADVARGSAEAREQ